MKKTSQLVWGHKPWDKAKLQRLTEKWDQRKVTFLVVDGTIVLDGNHRLAAARRLGVKRMPVVFYD